MFFPQMGGEAEKSTVAPHQKQKLGQGSGRGFGINIMQMGFHCLTTNVDFLSRFGGRWTLRQRLKYPFFSASEPIGGAKRLQIKGCKGAF